MSAPYDITSPAPAPKWRAVLRGVLIGWLCWTLHMFFHTQLIISQEPAAPYFPVLLTSSLSSYLYGVLCFGIWPWTRFLFGKRWPMQVAGHIAGAAAYAGIWYMLYRSLFIFFWGESLFRYTAIEEYAAWILSSTGMLYGVVAGIFHTIWFRRDIRQKEMNERELLLRASRMELAVLKSQLNPHFLFNTLNTVNALIGRNPEHARTVVAHLADTLRYSLDSDRRTLVPLEDELEFVRTYLAIERERFGNRLRADIRVDDREHALLIPPMILQPLVENAVRHGIAPKEDGGTVILAVTRRDGMLQFEVADDGVGAAGHGEEDLLKRGHGLFNTDQRLRKMFSEEHRLRLDTAGGGFRVVFSIPVIEEPDNHQPAPAHAASTYHR